ncbi:MAG: hypothetical protein A2Z29_10670 [Chloroflexi bacterium RBG_16_56_11]|nr:MAG: hypothetical protein A2Z29_10670 [Chloroflexi bacterium RBG_16_56_11]
MGVLFIVAVEAAAGKTTFSAGLAKIFLNDGKKVGYLKPQAASTDGSDGDTAFMKHLLGLADVVNAPDITKGRDIVLFESAVGPTPEDTLSKKTYGAVKEMKATVIAVETYTGNPSRFIDVYKGFGGSLLGVVINKVPMSQLQRAREEASVRLGASGIRVLGVIPENRALLAITVGELAGSIQGAVLNNPDKSGELVENFMLGAMVVGSGVNYFARKNNKAAIIWHDRPDIQLAALETSTSCLVLSGGQHPPFYNVLQKAQSRSIPIITTDLTNNDIVTKIEDMLAKTRLNQEKKIPVLTEMLKQNLDVKAIA